MQRLYPCEQVCSYLPVCWNVYVIASLLSIRFICWLYIHWNVSYCWAIYCIISFMKGKIPNNWQERMGRSVGKIQWIAPLCHLLSPKSIRGTKMGLLSRGRTWNCKDLSFCRGYNILFRRKTWIVRKIGSFQSLCKFSFQERNLKI
jgi:hypothetical protein